MHILASNSIKHVFGQVMIQCHCYNLQAFVAIGVVVEQHGKTCFILFVS